MDMFGHSQGWLGGFSISRALAVALGASCGLLGTKLGFLCPFLRFQMFVCSGVSSHKEEVMNGLMKNLTLIAAGALLATLILLPIITWANDDDEEDGQYAKGLPATYTLRTNRGARSNFTLVTTIDGNTILTLVPEGAARNSDDDD